MCDLHNSLQTRDSPSSSQRCDSSPYSTPLNSPITSPQRSGPQQGALAAGALGRQLLPQVLPESRGSLASALRAPLL
eukprot:SAG11_NODE_3201_length_2614_cov_2.037376_1_plen_76_part_10